MRADAISEIVDRFRVFEFLKFIGHVLWICFFS